MERRAQLSSQHSPATQHTLGCTRTTTSSAAPDTPADTPAHPAASVLLAHPPPEASLRVGVSPTPHPSASSHTTPAPLSMRPLPSPLPPHSHTQPACADQPLQEKYEQQLELLLLLFSSSSPSSFSSSSAGAFKSMPQCCRDAAHCRPSLHTLRTHPLSLLPLSATPLGARNHSGCSTSAHFTSPEWIHAGETAERALLKKLKKTHSASVFEHARLRRRLCVGCVRHTGCAHPPADAPLRTSLPHGTRTHPPASSALSRLAHTSRVCISHAGGCAACTSGRADADGGMAQPHNTPGTQRGAPHGRRRGGSSALHTHSLPAAQQRLPHPPRCGSRAAPACALCGHCTAGRGRRDGRNGGLPRSRRRVRTSSKQRYTQHHSTTRTADRRDQAGNYCACHCTNAGRHPLTETDPAEPKKKMKKRDIGNKMLTHRPHERERENILQVWPLPSLQPQRRVEPCLHPPYAHLRDPSPHAPLPSTHRHTPPSLSSPRASSPPSPWLPRGTGAPLLLLLLVSPHCPRAVSLPPAAAWMRPCRVTPSW